MVDNLEEEDEEEEDFDGNSSSAKVTNMGSTFQKVMEMRSQ